MDNDFPDNRCFDESPNEHHDDNRCADHFENNEIRTVSYNPQSIWMICSFQTQIILEAALLIVQWFQ